ncbi:hypothetical protein [Pandoraea pnomenusa]|uniref:hypothetical protein n=1 Tax=Pandoraea pnomenusa TaxID=93220 RepID=UPI00334240B6
MKTIHTACCDRLREQGMTTFVGSPNSNELPFLTDFPSDFQYIPGLQEAAVVGIADGSVLFWSISTPQPVPVTQWTL